MDRRPITVFGGSGFIGRHIVKRLAADDWCVRVAVRDPEAANFLRTAGNVGQVVPIAADVADAATVKPAVEGAEAVINLVGILYQRGRRTFRRVHVDGAANTAKAAAAAGATRFIQMSALGADPTSPAVYARTKAAGEQAVRDAFAGATVVRPSVVFGPEDDFFNRFAGLARILPALPVLNTSFQPVYVGDVADAFLKILTDSSTAGKTYELGGPRVISFREIMELVLKETRRRRLLIPLPLKVAAVEAWFLEKLPVPPLTRDQVKLMERDNVVSEGAPTLKDLGIEPTAVEVVLPTYLGQYRPPSLLRRRLP